MAWSPSAKTRFAPLRGHDEFKSERQKLDASTHTTTIDETSARYDGWRIVVVCFLLATFGWGARLLWPERLCRRTASAARLAGIADLERHHLLLSVRRAAGCLRQRSDPQLWSAQLPAGGAVHT